MVIKNCRLDCSPNGGLNVNSTSGDIGVTDITFLIAFPAAFRHLSALMSTNDLSVRFTGFDIANTTTTKTRFADVTPTSNSIYWMAIGY